MKDFEIFEQQMIELVGEFQSVTVSEGRLRNALRVEATRAETAEVAREAAERASVEAQNNAAAAAAGATQAASALAKAHDDNAGLKIKLELVERQRTLLEERCTDLSGQLCSLEQELQQLRPLQPAHTALQRQYMELQDRIRVATEEARKESSRLESELRRVEKCASGGSEIRTRARLAAAAHARERRLAAADLRHTTQDLHRANSEIARLNAHVAELQHRFSVTVKSTNSNEEESRALSELRSALAAERAGAARLERALAAALADNAALAAAAREYDNKHISSTPPEATNNIFPIDSFLAE